MSNKLNIVVAYGNISFILFKYGSIFLNGTPMSSAIDSFKITQLPEDPLEIISKLIFLFVFSDI